MLVTTYYIDDLELRRGLKGGKNSSPFPAYLLPLSLSPFSPFSHAFLSFLSYKSSWSWRVGLTLNWLSEWNVTLHWSEFLILKVTKSLSTLTFMIRDEEEGFRRAQLKIVMVGFMLLSPLNSDSIVGWLYQASAVWTMWVAVQLGQLCLSLVMPVIHGTLVALFLYSTLSEWGCWVLISDRKLFCVISPEQVLLKWLILLIHIYLLLC